MSNHQRVNQMSVLFLCLLIFSEAAFHLPVAGSSNLAADSTWGHPQPKTILPSSTSSIFERFLPILTLWLSPKEFVAVPKGSTTNCSNCCPVGLLITLPVSTAKKSSNEMTTNLFLMLCGRLSQDESHHA